MTSYYISWNAITLQTLILYLAGTNLLRRRDFMGGATDALDLSSLRLVEDEGAPRGAVYRTCFRCRAVRTLQYSASLFRTAAICPIPSLLPFVGSFLLETWAPAARA